MTVVFIITMIAIVALIRGIFGFGDGLILVPALLFILPLPEANIVSAIYGILIGSLLVFEYKKQLLLNIKESLSLSLVSIGGSFIGIYYGLHYAHAVQVVLCISLMAYPLIYYKMLRRIYLPYGLLTVIFGVIGGFIGGAVSANGPVLVLYGQLRKLKPGDLIIILQPVFLTSNIINYIVYGNEVTLLKTAYLATFLSLPLIFCGIYFGRKIRMIIHGKFDFFLVAVIFLMGIISLCQLIWT